MIIIQLSDTHIPGWGKNTCEVAPMAENLRRCVEHINQLVPRPDLILVSGDITHSGLAEEFDQAASILSRLIAPCFVIPGNHDNRENFVSEFSGTSALPDKPWFTSEQPFINYVIDGFDLRLIALDSTSDGKPGGEICETRAAWLNDRLAEAPSKPTIIFMHHPPIMLSVRETNSDGFSGIERLGEIIEKYPNIERIACGHVHLPTFARWRGTIISTAPSTGMSLMLDLTLKQESAFHLEQPSYHLHHWTPEKNLVTHTIRATGDNQYHSF